MNRTYILYNPNAANGRGKYEAEVLEIVYNDPAFCDMTQIGSYGAFFAGLDDSDEVILCGGDGTLNRFVNDTRDIAIRNNLYFYPMGTGNDFARDLGYQAFSARPFVSMNISGIFPVWW